MKIALVKPPSTYADWYKRPVLGLSYVCAYLEENGFECNIFDAYFFSISVDELIHRILHYRPDVVGISAMTHEIIQANKIASSLKEKLDIPIIIGGCHVTALPSETLTEFACFDYGVYGEGEYTALDLMRYLENGNPDIRSIKGLVYRGKDKNPIVNEARYFLTSEELNSLPYPALHHYYGKGHALIGKDSYYVMFTSRGCPYHCVFCMQVLGRKVRRRSVDNVLGEIQHAISKYGAHTFDFADEIFLFDGLHTRDLLQRMVEEGLSKKIRWKALTHVNSVNEKIIALAKKAGCYQLEMGVESGDDEILENIGKGISVEKVRIACNIIKENGIKLGTYFILGHPNETVEKVKKTLNLAVELNTDTIAVGIMVPYPGTKVYEMALRGEAGYRLLTKDWSAYDKYGGGALELETLRYNDLLRWQKKVLISFYIKNFRLIDLMKYCWARRRALTYFLRKLLKNVLFA
jgi:anaerobic magnesium-protoporphyrin IX monomethyl ester cyclase